jgi:TolB-like protein
VRRSLLPVLLATLLYHAPAASRESIKIAVVDLTPIGTPGTLAQNLTAAVVTELSRVRLLEVVSREEILKMLSFEENRMMLGCTDAVCLAEIGGALGVEYLVTGNVGQVGDRVLVNLQLIDIRQIKVVNRIKRETGSEGEMLASVASGARELVAKVLSEKPGLLMLHVGEEGADVYLDDSLRGVTPVGVIELASGPHRLRVGKKGFVDWAKEIEIDPDETETVEITLIPSREYIESYESRHGSLRTWAWIASGSAAAFGAAALGLFLYADQSYFPNEVEPYRKDCIEQGRSCPDSLRDKVEQNGTTYDRMIYSVYALDALLVLSAGAALYCWLAGDDPDRYEKFRRTEVQIHPAPSGGFLSATFRF